MGGGDILIFGGWLIPPVFLFAQVKVTRRHSKTGDEQLIRCLQKGEFFGERALQGYVEAYSNVHGALNK